MNPEVLRQQRYQRPNRSRRQRSQNEPYTYHGMHFPVTYTFICVPENGDKRIPQMPRKGSSLFVELEENRMVLDIEFTRGDFDYCKDRVIQEFSHLPLMSFRFYQSNSNGSRLIRSSHTYDNFDVRTLRRYLFYIGLSNLGLPVVKYQRCISGLSLLNFSYLIYIYYQKMRKANQMTTTNHRILSKTFHFLLRSHRQLLHSTPIHLHYFIIIRRYLHTPDHRRYFQIIHKNGLIGGLIQPLRQQLLH